MIRTVARRESGSLLRSAQTWLIASALAVLFAYLFLRALEIYLEVQPKLAMQDHPPGLSGYISAAYFQQLVFVFALIVPLLSMRSFSDEFRQHTMALWQSSPISSTSLALGKFLGTLKVVLLLVLLATVIPLTMRAFTPLDLGVLASSALGIALASCAFCSIGVFFSSLTQHPILAMLGSILALALLWLIGSAPSDANPALSIAYAFSIPAHLPGFFQGYLSSADILYFILLTSLFLALTVIRLDALRHTGR